MSSLFRLEGGREPFEFEGQNEEKVIVYAHHPSSEEVAAALAEAGVDLESAKSMESGTLEGLAATARFGGAYENLASYCIDSCSAFDVKRAKGPYGLRKLDAESEAQLAPILRHVGVSLYQKSAPDKEEGEG